MNRYRSYQQLESSSGPFCCINCGTTDERLKSHDHILPRSACTQNGKDYDSIDNIQWMCVRCNSSKGTAPDEFWSRELFFDFPVDVSKLRNGQKALAIEPFEVDLDIRKWFGSQFPSQVAGHFYLLAAATGAGKTVVAGLLPHSLNKLWLEENSIDGHKPIRVNQCLIVCDSDAMREQLSQDLWKDMTNYGGRPVSKDHVFCLDEGCKNHPQTIKNVPYVVTTPHMIDVMDPDERDKFLARFQLMVVDEPQKGFDRVMRLVDWFKTGPVIGLTASPCDSKGKMFSPCVLLGCWTDFDARDCDNGHKNLQPPDNGYFFCEIGCDRAVVTKGKELPHTFNATYQEQKHQYLPSLYVGRAVAERLLDLDAMDDCERSDHRSDSCIVDLDYVPQAMIKCRDGEQAAMLKADLEIYLSNVGVQGKEWEVGVAMSKDAKSNGRNNFKPLTQKHPWIRGKQRIILIVGQGREGVNQPPCLVVGYACPINSVVEVIQRGYGRNARGVQDGNRVPGLHHDTRHLITHEAFGNRDVIENAYRVIETLSELVAGMMTCADLYGSTEEYKPIIEHDMPRDDKQEIVLRYVNLLNSNHDISESNLMSADPVIDKFKKTPLDKSEATAEYAKKVAMGSHSAICEAIGGVTFEESVDQPISVEIENDATLHVSEREIDSAIASDEMLKGLQLSADQMEQARKHKAAEILKRKQERFSLQCVSQTNFTEIKDSLKRELRASVRPFIGLSEKANKQERDEWYSKHGIRYGRSVKKAIAHSLDMVMGIRFNKTDFQYNTRYHEYRIRSPHIRQRILMCARGILIKEGVLPTLDVALKDFSNAS